MADPPPPPPNANSPSSKMPNLRSQAEFFMTGVMPTGPLRDSDCTICTEELVDDVVKMLSCEHSFHCVCILAWLQGNRQRNRCCPNCRHELYEAAPMPFGIVRERVIVHSFGGQRRNAIPYEPVPFVPYAVPDEFNDFVDDEEFVNDFGMGESVYHDAVRDAFGRGQARAARGLRRMVVDNGAEDDDTGNSDDEGPARMPVPRRYPQRRNRHLLTENLAESDEEEEAEDSGDATVSDEIVSDDRGEEEMARSSSRPSRWELESPINISAYHASHPSDPSRDNFDGLYAGVYGRDTDIPMPTPQSVDDTAHGLPSNRFSQQGQRANHVGASGNMYDSLHSRTPAGPQRARPENERQDRMPVITRRFTHRRPALVRVHQPPRQSATSLHNPVMQARANGAVLPPWLQAYQAEARADAEELVQMTLPVDLDRVRGDGARVTRSSRQEPTAGGALRRRPGGQLLGIVGGPRRSRRAA